MQKTYQATYRHSVYPDIRYSVPILAESAEEARHKAVDWPYMGQFCEYVLEGVA